MSHAKFRHALCLVPVLFALAACSGGGNNNNNGNSAMEMPQIPDPPTPPTPPTDFTAFVIDQFANTADDTDPVQVNEVEFSYPDQDNPAAFDALLE